MTIGFNANKVKISNLDATYPIECDSMEELKNKIVECSHRESAEFRISKQDINKAEIFVDSCTADNMTEVWFDYNVATWFSLADIRICLLRTEKKYLKL